MFSFLLSEGRRFELRGTCALVENPAVFTAFERLQLKVGLVIYGHGRTSNRLVEWLATNQAPNFQLLHLPDYDPVGLSEFDRLRTRLGPYVRLYLPPDLDQRFNRFSNRKLLGKRNSLAMLAALQNSPFPEIRKVVELIRLHSAGLEQEP